MHTHTHHHLVYSLFIDKEAFYMEKIQKGRKPLAWSVPTNMHYSSKYYKY